MKRKLLIRCLIGAPLGVAIGMTFTIIISLMVGDGQYYAVVPELISDFGNEINAVIVQFVCCLLYGAVWAGASLIWEQEWSLLRQTATHLIVCSLATFPVAYFNRWMKHDAFGIILYFAIFIGIYAVIWFFQFFAIKKRIDRLNEKLSKKT